MTQEFLQIAFFYLWKTEENIKKKAGKKPKSSS